MHWGTWLLVLLVIPVDAKKSCETPCNDQQCGTWIDYDNSRKASGVYLLNEGTLNLTCSLISLPKPSPVLWWFRADHAQEWRTFHCSSLRKVTDCSFNDKGEHRVTSTCYLKMTQLEQSGVYQCTAGDEKNPAISKTAHVKVYGISNITVHNKRLKWGRLGLIEVQICANPTPDIFWIPDSLGKQIPVGSSAGNYSALSLQSVVSGSNVAKNVPAQTERFCHLSKLLVSSVSAADSGYQLVVSNAVATRRKHIGIPIVGVPSGASTPMQFYSLFIPLVIFAWICA